uniref:Cytochrome c oxidase subunit 3 n=1 Tax=Megaris sp. TaxID=2931300 RepID=A0A8T9ZWJ7_9HEMI|nr:cytochrome c oxidase subunit III [Megaris sp.]
MNLHNNHAYHLVNASPWPLTSSIGSLTMFSGIITMFHLHDMKLMTLGYMIIIMSMMQWWRDIIRESTFQGLHTNKVMLGLKMGMILFIMSEVLFFLSFFWSFYHSSLSPTTELGMNWPPKGIITFNPMHIPLLNTMILLASGITVTWTHHSLMNNKYNSSLLSLLYTVTLGLTFTTLQVYEYLEALFCINDSIYGSCFFVATGFHGLHVIIGSIFLITCLIRLKYNHFSINHHLGFELSAWYWHFVDVIWLFLYISIYWWGS